MKSGTVSPFSAIIFLILLTACKKSSSPADASINLPYVAIRTEADLDTLIRRIGKARIVLLGEASHGTHEYYTWRAAITRRLIREAGFTIIGVEGEWADSYRVNQFIKGPRKDSAQALSLLRQYDRWPTWMWGNYEIASLVTWLNHHNGEQGEKEKVSFYGLDVYCLWESMQELRPFIAGNDSLMRLARQVEQCFQPYSDDPGKYALAVANAGADCRAATERLWNAVQNTTGREPASRESDFVMQQNALVALNGEAYYRASASSFPGSWNIRDRHMTHTIERLLRFHGPESKIIVWEHNTHVGDARATDMAAAGMVNVGQLTREKFGEANVYIVGFGSYRGSVIAAPDWGARMRTMTVPPAQKGSWEYLLHQMGGGNKLLFSSDLANIEMLRKPIGHRAIGVQYDPSNERGNYVPSLMASRYDAFLFFDRTKALQPLGTRPKNEPPDTYPSGY